MKASLRRASTMTRRTTRTTWAKVRRQAPGKDEILASPWMAPVRPHLQDDRLWHLERHCVARGVATGLFMGLLMPVAQILFAVAASVAVRGNVPVSAACTLVTNPLTVPPIYYAAYQIGERVLPDALDLTLAQCRLIFAPPTPHKRPTKAPAMTTIRHDDLVESVAAALQYISYYHPADYIAHLARAYEREESPAAKDAIAQILTNSRMCAEGHRPICQDTGIVNVFLKIGMGVKWEGFGARSIQDAVDEGVRRGYNNPDNKLRASVLSDPIFERKNTKDNTPAVVFMELVPGDTVDVTVAAKGGGSENKSKVYMLNPSDNIVDWVLKTVPTLGAGWCPPGMLGIGVGGTAEKAALLAKESLMDDIDMYELLERGPSNKLEELRIELYEKVNALGIGAQGLGGLTTVLDVKIKTYPTHAASKPIAMIRNGAPPRHAHFVMDGSGPVYLDPPSLDLWPNVHWAPDYNKSKRVDLNTLTKEEVASWKPGQPLLLNGKMLTGRAAPHKRGVWPGFQLATSS